MVESVEKGSIFVDGEIIIDPEKKKTDEGKSDAKITVELIKGLANKINPMVQLTVDTPCKYEDQKLPILDVKTNINTKEKNRIDFEFYEKPTKNPKVMLANSANNPGTKRTILSQECLRRLQNTKLELGQKVQNKHLSDFMLKLKNSGYTQKYRKEILKSALKAYNKMVEDDKTEKKPLYRNKNWKKEERIKSKINKKQNWYKTKSKFEYKSVLFVPPTPGGLLVKRLKKREEELNKDNEERIKIVEKAGTKMGNILTQKNPFKKSKCKEDWCPLCRIKSAKNPATACSTNNDLQYL